MSLEKPAQAMAGEIQRRLLPDYLRVLEWAKQAEAEENDYAAKRRNLLRRFAQAIGGSYDEERDRLRTPSFGELYLYNNKMVPTPCSLRYGPALRSWPSRSRN
jgi:hypothetical protein